MCIRDSTGSIGEIDFTLDYYSIEVSDYFSAISTLDVSTTVPSAPETYLDDDGAVDPDAYADAVAAYANYNALDAAGVSGANSIGGVFYFTNAYDYSVSGWDLVATYPIDWDAGSTLIGVTISNSEREFDSDPSAYLNEEGRYDVINFDPNMRMVTSVTHNVWDYNFMTRWIYYGEASNFNSDETETFDPMSYIDMELSYFADKSGSALRSSLVNFMPQLSTNPRGAIAPSRAIILSHGTTVSPSGTFKTISPGATRAVLAL